jgi:hypothetical protein
MSEWTHVYNSPFKRAGLDFDVDYDAAVDDEDGNITVTFHDDGGFPATGVDAAAALFDISLMEAELLFLPDAYPRGLRKGAKAERAVAKRIRRFVAGKEEAPSTGVWWNPFTEFNHTHG